MTVKELIAELQMQDGDTRVMVKEDFFGMPAYDIYCLEMATYSHWTDKPGIKKHEEVIVFSVC